MKVKIIKVLDVGTESWYLVGKPEAADKEWMSRVGWGDGITLIVHPCGGGYTEAAISHFTVPEIDMRERGNMGVSSTSVGLAKAVREASFEDLPDVLDLREKKRGRFDG